MDLKMTGEFIQECRKNKKLTQVQLAQKIGVSEKTISKWECGKGFPDTTLMLPLCKVLGISANELLSAKKFESEKEYVEVAENNLIALKSQQEKSVKHLLFSEWVMIWFSMVILLSCVGVASYIDLPTIWRVLILIFGFANLFVAIWVSIVIETKAGFYECGKCGHKYVPEYKQVLWSMHMGRTRYMKCPECNKRSWNKKRINKD